MTSKEAKILILLTLILLLPLSALGQAPASMPMQADARAEIAAALFAASATQAAAERAADAKIRRQRDKIEELREKVRTSVGEQGELRAALTRAEEEYVADLAERDRVYAQEITVFREAVEDIAATPESVLALARFNAGDEVGALAFLDELRAARNAAREKRAAIESAAEGRRIATLALDARSKGKVSTEAVIVRFEEVTALDPDVHWDWVELGRLYTDAGRLADAERAAKAAMASAQSDRDRSVAHNELGDVQVKQGQLSGALASYRAGLAIAKRLAEADPGNAGWQRDLIVSFVKLGDVTSDSNFYQQVLDIALDM